MTFDNPHSEPGLMNMIGNNVSFRNWRKKNKGLTSLLYKNQQSTKNGPRTPRVSSQKKTSTNGFKHMK